MTIYFYYSHSNDGYNYYRRKKDCERSYQKRLNLGDNLSKIKEYKLTPSFVLSYMVNDLNIGKILMPKLMNKFERQEFFD